jgi:sterol 3beta-glucosyltransferase
MAVPHRHPFQAVVHDPISAKGLDTSPKALHVQDQSLSEDQKDDGPKGRVKRVVEKTVDKLGRSLSTKSPTQSSPRLSPSPSASKRLFSLSRKAKGKHPGDQPEGENIDITLTVANFRNVADIIDDSDGVTSPHSTHSSRPMFPHKSRAVASPTDDSPFIRPESPSPPPPSRPSLQAFRGDGSVCFSSFTCYSFCLLTCWYERCALEHRLSFKPSKLYRGTTPTLMTI